MDRERLSEPSRSHVGRQRDLRLELPVVEDERTTDDVVRVCSRGTSGQEQHRGYDAHVGTLTCLALAACQPALAELDGIFYDGDGRKVHCAANLDETAGLATDDILAAIDRAAERGEVIELYAHEPGRTVSLARLRDVFVHARDLGLTYVTYAEMAAGAVGPGVALSFDDHAVQAWSDLRPTFAELGVRATFFVSGHAFVDETGRALLRELASDGHEIAAHSVLHLRAPPFVERHGLRAYVDEEVVPSIESLAADGHAVTSFAYPFGARTAELDEALLRHVRVLRTIDFPYTSSVQSTCPH